MSRPALLGDPPAPAPSAVTGLLELTPELDGLSKSSRADVSSAAREATLWLDSTARGARVGRRSRLRIESRAERAAAAIETQEGVGIPAREDDAVISCCMWFQRAARVLLWTHDRNLAVLAEGSDVPTLVGRAGLLRMLREAGVEPDADEGMELDEQIVGPWPRGGCTICVVADARWTRRTTRSRPKELQGTPIASQSSCRISLSRLNKASSSRSRPGSRAR